MDERQKDLSAYRITEADDSLKVADHCLKEGLYKNSINRSYYASFYAIKAVLALSTVVNLQNKHITVWLRNIQRFNNEWGGFQIPYNVKTFLFRKGYKILRLLNDFNSNAVKII